MIVDVMKDMIAFLLILLIALIAFVDTFLALSMANPADDGRFTFGFIDSLIYTYKMVLGDMNANIREDFG